MNEYLLDPKVCPSSLGENDEPMDVNETAHKWDEDTGECNECGAKMTTRSMSEIYGDAKHLVARYERFPEHDSAFAIEFKDDSYTLLKDFVRATKFGE